MTGFQSFFMLIEFFFVIVIGMYFLHLLRGQNNNRSCIEKESRKQMAKLQRMRAISLSEPLTENTRPESFSDIVGQDDGIKMLRAALCGSHPHHVLIYGPPGVGKTAAARLVLQEAKQSELSPFRKDAKFVELDATTARFDERGIADPLIGSVHDPIYQGAGQMGQAGIPQPKPGAVTKAHGGILFIDEIGELHSVQLNKLLKVLEDRRVFLESSYYNSEDEKIPEHIHEIFKNGLPADFRLVGATTRQPEEINPAIRSRCLEVFFKPLQAEQLGRIAENVTRKISYQIEPQALDLVKTHCCNGREVVNLLQFVVGLAQRKNSTLLRADDVEWIVQSGQYALHKESHIRENPQVGVVNGLAVCGSNQGVLEELEVSAIKVAAGQGQVIVTGIIEEEEISSQGRKYKAKSMVKNSVETVCTVLRKEVGLSTNDYDIHINFSGGVPINGPSAGVTMATAIYSAILELPIDNTVAMTGELSVRGLVRPVGGILAKVEAAVRAGVKTIIIPSENYQDYLQKYDGVSIIPTSRLEDVLKAAIGRNNGEELSLIKPTAGLMSAAGRDLIEKSVY